MSLRPTEPILILSDLHLGHRASRIKHPEQLAPMLQGPGTVIFNGDTSEMRNPEDRLVGRKLAADLARICHQLGRRAVFVNGNHDLSTPLAWARQQQPPGRDELARHSAATTVGVLP